MTAPLRSPRPAQQQTRMQGSWSFQIEDQPSFVFFSFFRLLVLGRWHLLFAQERCTASR
jgi:hypothetical protein